MHTQNSLVKFYQFVLKILSGNEILMNGRNDGQPKSSKAPFYQSGPIIRALSTNFLTPPPVNVLIYLYQIPYVDLTIF